MATLQELADFWSAEGINYVIPPVGGEFPEGFDVREMLRKIIDPSGGVLEVGCGYGRLSAAFPADKYVGVDVNPTAIEQARKRNPEHRYLVIEPGADLPEANSALIYTVALHVSDQALDEFLTPICKAANTIVIAEIMDERWRRDGVPPVFNRDPEAYVGAMRLQGFELLQYGKVVYERYNNANWNVNHDVRLTVHIYRRKEMR
ncbi:class I SAM-dependent methyltransferase [Pseudomonas knackmussii]|uniref:class I SAM-dependent methyltransferase n=1 Tax=Pseudomonas knackmussii TaxID=65741 RepID=UPI0013622342|nr:class I SAM-dependent methyltransferase [Pseudomonas knackmussii]